MLKNQVCWTIMIWKRGNVSVMDIRTAFASLPRRHSSHNHNHGITDH
jgi:hypothetical protein